MINLAFGRSIAIAGLGTLLAAVVPAQAETNAQKLKYLTDLAGTSCSADKALVLLIAPNGSGQGVTVAAPAYVTVKGGRLDSHGGAWAYVTDEKTKTKRGYVRLEELSCI